MNQHWRGAKLIREPYLRQDDKLLWWNNPSREGALLNEPPLLLLCGTREYLRLADPGPEAFYEEQVAMMKDRAPA